MANSPVQTGIRLQESDWDALFPGVDYTIGSTTFKLVPLSLKGIATITSKLSSMAATFAVVNVTLEDVDSRNIESLTGLVEVIVNEAPEILSIMSGLHLEDVRRLPLTVAVDLFSRCLDVNIDSQESLVKNFKTLGDKFSKFLGQEPSTEKKEPEVTLQDRNRISVN